VGVVVVVVVDPTLEEERAGKGVEYARVSG
jgi:hypothetical protein